MTTGVTALCRRAGRHPGSRPVFAHALWAEAEVVIGTIESSDERARALWALATALAQAQQWERAHALWAEAEVVIGTIEKGYQRARALGALASALAQAQQWERAQTLIGTIEESSQRVEALGAMATSLAVAGKHEELLRLVQRSWWLANTREEALQLFPMAIRLIPRNPELGLALHEAFTRVDTFLKE